MFEYIDDKKLMGDIKMLMRFPPYKASLYHKVEELKGKDEIGAGKIQEFRELEKRVDQNKEEKAKEPTNTIRFKIHRSKKSGWVKPVYLPGEIFSHITTMDLKPGIIEMQKFKLQGKMVDLSFEMQARDFITGSIKGEAIAAKEKVYSKTRKADKKEITMTMIDYLRDSEDFFNWMSNEFFQYWKPLIDDGFIGIEKEINER